MYLGCVLAILDLMSFEQRPLPLREKDADWYEELHSKDCEAKNRSLYTVLLTSPVDKLENQCSKATQSNQGNDLEAKPDFCVRAYYEGASCADNQDAYGNE